MSKAKERSHQAEAVECADDDFEIAIACEEFESVSTSRTDDSQLRRLLARCRPSVSEHPAVSVSTADPRSSRPTHSALHPVVGSRSSPDATRPTRTSQNAPAIIALAKSSSVIGIDFGTSFSSASAVVGGQCRILPLDSKGASMIPTVVAFNERGEALVGQEARAILLQSPEYAIASPKRLLGRRHDDREAQPYLAQIAMPSCADDNGLIQLNARGRQYSVAQLCAPLLFTLKLAASRQLGRNVTEVVIAVPVSFDLPQRQALRQACTIAGLRVRRFIDEPSAAVLAQLRGDSKPGLYAVYDFGGGTFDFSVIRAEASGKTSVVTNAGDSWLGGDDFDEVLAGEAANRFWREHKLELRNNAVQWQRLLSEAERVKRVLSRRPQAKLALQDVAITAKGSLHLEMTVDRAHFANVSQSLVERSIDTCMTALDLCEIKPSELTGLFMSGGTSYLPSVLNAVSKAFGLVPLMPIPPELAVCLGTASYASRLAARDEKSVVHA